MRKAKRNYREIYRQRQRENEGKRDIIRYRIRRERIIISRYIDRDRERIRDILFRFKLNRKKIKGE